jgi:hypothetical protein
VLARIGQQLAADECRVVGEGFGAPRKQLLAHEIATDTCRLGVVVERAPGDGVIHGTHLA